MLTTTPRTRLGPWGISRFPDGPFTGKTETVLIAGTPTIRDGVFRYAHELTGVYRYAQECDGRFVYRRKRPGVLA